MDKKVIVIDLDGTFMLTNTFHQWIKFLFKEELKKFHFITLSKILKIMLLRFLKYIDHSQMKYKILKISENNMEHKQIHLFVHSLDKYLNNNILDMLSNKTDTFILATAAPMQYANYIKRIYYFDYVIATGYTSDNAWTENIRKNKQMNLKNLLNTEGLNHKIDILFTDHHDDLALMYDAHITYLVNPSKETKIHIRNAGIKFILC